MLPIPFVTSAKIAVPQLPREFVVRTRLRAHLEAADPADVGLVCAPAGYGKTLLLADWALNSTAADVAWVGLDRDDNDPKRLWASVIAAVAACPSVPSDIRLHGPWVLRPADQPEFLAELGLVLQRLPRPIRLILDDLHELVDPDALHGVQIFMRNRPAKVQLVLSSRLDPPLSLRRLRLAGRLWELRAERLRFSEAEAATPARAVRRSSHPRAGRDAARSAPAGGRRACDWPRWPWPRPPIGMASSPTFSGDERSVADYLVEEIISRAAGGPPAVLRWSASATRCRAAWPCSCPAGRTPASVLDRLEHQTSLVAATGPRREAYRVQELLRTYLRADLHRQGPQRVAELHATAARWWADQDRPVPALDHAAAQWRHRLLSDLLRRFAVALVLNGEHRPLRRALSSLGARATAADPWLALTSALTHIEVGDLRTARADLRQARRSWPSQDTADLRVLRAVAEQFAATVSVRRGGGADGVPMVDGAAESTGAGELPTEPQLQALARLGRGSALLLERDDRAGARADLEAALVLARRHGFDHLAMQCLVLLGVIAGTSGDLRTMRAVSTQALAAVCGPRLGKLDVVCRRIGDARLRRAPAQRRPPGPIPVRAGPGARSGGVIPTAAVHPADGARRRRLRLRRPGRAGWPSCSRRAPRSAACAWG